MENSNSRIIVVSGGSGGVGAEILKYFGDQNWICFSIDTNRPKVKLENQIYIEGDLSALEEAKNIVYQISKITNKVDLLVNGAGRFADDASCLEDPERIINLWKDNFMSSYFLSTEIFTLLQNSNSALVVNISSTDSIVASAGQNCEIGIAHDIIYASTKGALNTLTKALAMKWAKNNIRVNAICPTIIRTPMTRSLLSEHQKEAQLTDYIPLGRICEPFDIPIAIDALYKMNMTTGHLLTIDGGYLCQ